MQVRDKDKQYREARAASRAAEKLLLDPPPTKRITLHVRPPAPHLQACALLELARRCGCCCHRAAHACCYDLLVLPAWLHVLRGVW